MSSWVRLLSIKSKHNKIFFESQIIDDPFLRTCHVNWVFGIASKQHMPNSPRTCENRISRLDGRQSAVRKSRQTDRQQGPLSRCLYVVPRDLKIFQKKRVHYIPLALPRQTILAGRKWKDLKEEEKKCRNIRDDKTSDVGNYRINKWIGGNFCSFFFSESVT